jgi:hypothetical protein
MADSFKNKQKTMIKDLVKYMATVCFVAGVFCSCTGSKDGNNQLTDKEKKDGWVLLFDGQSTDGWHLFHNDSVKSNWIAKNGELSCNTDYHLEHRDIVSDKEFENFDLTFEWKIALAGNSGVFIDVLERPDMPSTWASGPEYQLLEKSNPDYETPNKRSGCIFGFAPPINPADSKPQGEWNQSRIRQINGKIEFYLNGVLTAQQDLLSAAWPEMISHTNFKNYPEFGKHTKGHIALQYWLKGISFRNIKIKEL